MIHYDCAQLTNDEIEFYNISENKFFCCKRCESAPLTCPPHLQKKKKDSNCVTAENGTAEFTLNPAAPPFVPGCQYVSDVNNVISKVTHSNLSQTVVPTTSNPNKQTDNSSLTVRANIAKSSGFVYFHKFLEIRCSFLCPNDLDNAFLSRDNSEFVIFHNNINSMCDTETDKIS